MDKKEFVGIFSDLLVDQGVELYNLDIYMFPIEENKNYNSTDDMFRLVICNPLSELHTKKLTFDETIRILTWKRDIYPMWVDIYIENNTKVYLYFSRRFRKYSEVCMCKNRSIPPFRIIEEKMCITSNPPFERT
jgi:hypothetical protein